MDLTPAELRNILKANMLPKTVFQPAESIRLPCRRRPPARPFVFNFFNSFNFSNFVKRITFAR